MASVEPGFGVAAVDAQVTTLNATLASMQSAMTTLQGQMTAMQTFAAQLNLGGFYPSVIIDQLLEQRAELAHTHDVDDLHIILPLKEALRKQTMGEVRTALGLGSAATANVGDFEAAGSVAAANAMTPADVDERARDAVGAALIVQNGLIYGRTAGGADAQFAAGLAWQLRIGSTLVSQGAAGTVPPGTGLSVFTDDPQDKIRLVQVAFWNDPSAAGVGGETGGNFGSSSGSF